MAGVSLPSLKRRLKTVTNTRKITKAMALVSSSKYQKARIALYKNEIHFKFLSDIVSEVVKNAGEIESIFFNNKNRNKKLYVLLNSDRGLVGSYNTQLIAKAFEMMSVEEEVPYIITTGKKGFGVLRKVMMDDKSELLEISDVPDFTETTELFDHIFGLYKSGYVNQVELIYMKYITPIKNELTVERLLPFDKVESKDEIHSQFDFEPSAEEMVDEVFTMYLKEKIYNVILNAKTAEQSVRMSSMNSATKNADELIANLNNTYNRLRQSAITQEISGIVGGAEALR